ncbi:MAG: YdjY domain-containing protein [Candidatus Poribacteria bacterium]
MTIDTKKREATIRGWVNMNAGLIEYLACSAGGKLHESVLVLDTKPIHLQVALILIGLEAKGDFEFQGDPRPPKGDPVEIWVQWKQGEKIKRVKAEQMILDSKNGKPMPETDWIFTGSLIHEGRFLAEIEKSLIATYHDPVAIINNPLLEGADDTVYYANSTLVPKRGTSVIVTIKAVGEAKKSVPSQPDVAEALEQTARSRRARVLFSEHFDSGILDTSRWKITKDGDFNQLAVDVKDIDSSADVDYRLRLMANTIGTSDSVKYLGARSQVKIDFSQPTEIAFDLDWNAQQNGCYLTAGLYICPVESENPQKEKDWVRFEWVGVPPGKNIRANVWASSDGAMKQLYTDWGPVSENGKPQGWPVKPGNHRIKLMLDSEGIRVWADSKQLCYAQYSFSFTSAYLYLQMSSGANYPDREVYFDNIIVTAMGAQ